MRTNIEHFFSDAIFEFTTFPSKKIRLFASSFWGAHSRLIRTIIQQKIRALVSAHRDRHKQKRNFRRLWIARINTVIREEVISYDYSKLIHDLYKKQLLLNRARTITSTQQDVQFT